MVEKGVVMGGSGGLKLGLKTRWKAARVRHPASIVGQEREGGREGERRQHPGRHAGSLILLSSVRGVCGGGVYEELL